MRGVSTSEGGSVIRHATRAGGGLRLAPSLVEAPRMWSANPPYASQTSGRDIQLMIGIAGSTQPMPATT
jgi:hypothetical protein